MASMRSRPEKLFGVKPVIAYNSSTLRRSIGMRSTLSL